MALRRLINFDDETFRKKSKPVTDFDARLADLLDDMYDTLKKSGGYGMAAAHIGVLRRVVVIDGKDGGIELVNPIITAQSKEVQRVFEGSIAPNAPWGYVVRPLEVTIAAADRFGEPIELTGSDFLAATLCHEIGHLDGVLFTDKSVEIITDCAKINEILRDRMK
jgi:peptide deformylase